MKKLSIRNQLRFIALAPVLCLALLYVLFYQHQYQAHVKQQIARLAKAYISQLLMIEQFHHASDSQALQATLDKLHFNPEINAAAFYDIHGHLLAARGGHPLHYLNQTQRQMGRPPHETLYSIQFIVPIPQTYCANLAVNPDPNLPELRHPHGWIYLDLDKKFILIKQYQMVLSTLTFVILCLIVGFMGHYFLAKHIYTPIQRLYRKIERIMHHDDEVQFESHDHHELGIIEQGCAHLNGFDII